jgi:hypothetical protein
MRNFQLLTFLIVLLLPYTFSYSSQEEVESASTACSNLSHCKVYLAQNTPTESPVDMSESKPIEAVSEELRSISNPLGQGSESIESVSKPIESLSKPLESVSKPLSSVSKPLGSVSKPVDSYLKPVDSVKNTEQLESKIEGEEEGTRGLGVDSIQGGKGEMEKVPSAVEGKYDSSDPRAGSGEPPKEGDNADLIHKGYDRIKGTRGTYCKWRDENGMIHIESGEKCVRE